MHRSNALLSSILCALACAPAIAADAPAATAQAAVQREVIGTRTSENVPAIPAALLEQLNRYQNTRGAGVAGWTKDGCLLISTRFAETAQAHRVCQPMGMREQLTFYPEPVGGITPVPATAKQDGFVFAKDVSGNEFSQLYWFDFVTRDVTLLTDGKRSQNNGALFTDDGTQLAYSSTSRNGKDTDIWLRDMRTGASKPLVTEGGNWSAMDFSPDGSELLVLKFVSANEMYPGAVDLATGKLELFPVDGGKAAFGGFQFAPDGKAVYFISDEPFEGKAREFKTLRWHDPASGALRLLSDQIPWDAQSLNVSDDGRHVAYTTNEDGINRLHVLALPGNKALKLPELPVGLIGGVAFSPDGKRLALTLNTATSPSDAYVIDLANAKLTRWTQREVGGLDSSKFIAPTLVRFQTFDTVDGKPRTIPAFYYKPTRPATNGKYPVIVNIHGGPEAQALPSFSATTQYLASELGVAVLVPNVRGSSGYGRTYLTLDNAEKREDSVKDIGALLDWVAKQPELDASRVGVQGGSYGGYMVLASLMHYPERIKAGVDIEIGRASW